MKILIIGCGGREHAIAECFARDERVTKLWCAPGNGGISEIAECRPVGTKDIPGIVALAEELAPDLVFVSPDDPLVMGAADELERAGFRVFGPNRAAARIEGSKAFAKALMEKYSIPTAKYAVFGEFEAAREYIEKNGAPIVVKADGLALGKGVTVAQNIPEAVEAARAALCCGAFGAAGRAVVIEECLSGPEVSVLAFTDGKTVVPMPWAADHKRAYDGDLGPNTGGMGAVAPSSLYTPELAEVCMERIFKPTVRAMAAEGCPFRGVLYFGLMLTAQGPKVIEYNARFGDPEAQAVLPLLKTSLWDITSAVIDGRLSELKIEFSGGACGCVVLASGGYPGKYETGFEISGVAAAKKAGAIVYQAGTRRESDKLYTSGGRVLSVGAKAETLCAAMEMAYDHVKHISFTGMCCRGDIGRGK